jgi:hypothetical protein
MQPGERKRASGHFFCSVTAKIIRNQAELFEGRFEVVDDFMGDEDKSTR